jgi:hypothetical protein
MKERETDQAMPNERKCPQCGVAPPTGARVCRPRGAVLIRQLLMESCALAVIGGMLEFSSFVSAGTRSFASASRTRRESPRAFE